MAPQTRSQTAKPSAAAIAMKRVPQVAFHVVGLFVCQYAFQSLPYVSNISGLDIESMFGGHYQFLTILGLWATRLAIALSLLNDFVAPFEPLQRAKTFVSAVALPTEVIISLLYWSILAINPDLLMPPKKVNDPGNPAQVVSETVRLPITIDMAMHAAPAVLLMTDYLLLSPPFPKTARPALISAATVLGYALWSEVCNSQNGHYPYPLLSVLDTYGRSALYAGCALVFVAIVKAADAVHYVIDGALGREWSKTEPHSSGTTRRNGARKSSGKASR